MTQPALDILWAVHVHGSDDIYAVVDRDAADKLKAALDEYDAATAADPVKARVGVRMAAEVVQWPFGKVEHAEALAEQDEDDYPHQLPAGTR